MFLSLLALERIPCRPVRRLRELVHEAIVPLFASESLASLALISALAGLGEEMLFRGLLQAGLAAWINGPHGAWLAMLVASLLFGLVHWISSSHAVLATVIGIYLGCLFWVSGHLLVPIVAHALYDFLALVWLVRWHPPENSKAARLC
jgi:membrane protease YdiL (CAAX protease family)